MESGRLLTFCDWEAVRHLPKPDGDGPWGLYWTLLPAGGRHLLALSCFRSSQEPCLVHQSDAAHARAVSKADTPNRIVYFVCVVKRASEGVCAYALRYPMAEGSVETVETSGEVG